MQSPRQLGLPTARVVLRQPVALAKDRDGEALQQPVFEIPFSNDAPPAEFRIFPQGEFDTRKGKFLFDDEAAASVMANYQDQGTEMHMDYEHRSLQPGSPESPAACWFKPELRDGELWATDVRWTPRAEQYLKGKEYRYFSPAFDAQKGSGRVMRLINVAVTNLPATKHLNPLVAASDKEPPVMVMDPERETCKTQLSAVLKILSDGDGDSDEALKSAMKALHETLSTQLGVVQTTATTQVAAREDSAAVLLREEVKSLTGKQDPADIRGTLMAWRQAHEQVTALGAQVAELRKSERLREFDAALVEGKRDGKVPPAKEKEFLALRDREDGLQTLRVVLSLASPVVSTTEVRAREAAADVDPEGAAIEQIALTAEEKEQAAAGGLSEEKMLKTKRADIQRQRDRMKKAK